MKRNQSFLYNLIFIFATILLFHSCMVGPKVREPEMEVPDAFLYDSTADSLVNLKWWEIFNDPLLLELIDTALRYNKDVLIAASRVEEAMYIVGYNRADIWPAFGYDGSASYGTIGSGGNILQDPTDAYSATANVFWELDFWGKYRRATQAAKAELVASEYGRRSVQVSLISSVATVYFQLLDYKNRLEISLQTLETRQKSLDIIQERFNEGIIPEIDLNQAQIQEAIAASAVPVYEKLVVSAEHALSILLGEFPHTIDAGLLIDQHLPDSIPAGIPSDLLERRPDINQAEQLYMAQTARIGVAQAMRFPSFSITGAFGAASSDLSSLLTNDAVIWSTAGGITGPIFQFGKNKRRVQIERERAEQALLSYENNVLNAFREVEDALFEVDAVARELFALQRQVSAAENAASLSRSRYDGGVTSYLEVLETERSLFNAELSLSDAFQRQLNAYVKLYKALGGGWITEEEMKAVQTTQN